MIWNNTTTWVSSSYFVLSIYIFHDFFSSPKDEPAALRLFLERKFRNDPLETKRFVEGFLSHCEEEAAFQKLIKRTVPKPSRYLLASNQNIFFNPDNDSMFTEG